MEQLRNIEQCLISTVQTQLGDLKHVNAKEMGEVIDMIKDLEEAMDYCSIIEAMEKTSEDKEKQQGEMNINYYMEPMRYYQGQPRNADGTFSSDGRRNYGEGSSSNSGGQGQIGGTNNSSNRYYVPYMEYAPYMMRDEGWRDDHMYNGRSGNSRRMYMEGKQYHSKDDEQSMKELEHYIKDLGEDLTDMIKESSTEEKQLLSSKLQQLATKINK